MVIIVSGIKLYFLTSQWLARDEGDGKIARDLVVSSGDAEVNVVVVAVIVVVLVL